MNEGALFDGNDVDITAKLAKGVADVAAFVGALPDVDMEELGKAIAVSALVLQQEAYTIIAEARGMDSGRRMKRANVAAGLLAKAGDLAATAGVLTRISKQRDYKPRRITVAAGDGAGSGLRLVAAR